MKNLLTFTNPEKKFTGYYENLVKIQIDNSLFFGWKPEDIIIATNFDHEYGGIKTINFDSTSYSEVRPRSAKTNALPQLIELGIVKDGIYWVHDFDAYQLNPFTEDELELDGYDIGLTDYGYKTRLSLGSYFFRREAKDLFDYIKDGVFKWGVEDEGVLKSMDNQNVLNINKRLKRLNITYNFAVRYLAEMYKLATQPIRVLHFRPEPYRLGQFMYGVNELKKPLMTDRLIELFKKHGIS